MQQPDSDPLLGRILEGRYLLTARIARGGMAGVYEAHDRRLDRIVAVKVMHSGLGDDKAYAARFVREARAAARLDHPNVVQVFDQGDDHGTLFLVMELVRGTTLRDRMTPGQPALPGRAVALMEPVLAALGAAHKADLIHRDVKPENVLLAEDGRVKVADFGLARAVTAATQHTSTGVLIGTVSYIAPEIVTDGRADKRSDVYSAGVMLYELLTGRKPHEGESPIQVAYKHVHEDVPPPSALVPSLPPYVDALVARATARDPDLRPTDAGVMLRHLQRVSQALAAGVTEDVELTTDLAPPRRPVHEATAVEALPDAEATAVRPRSRGTVEVSRPTPVPVAAPPEEPRKRRRGPFAVLLAVLLVAVVGGGAWWFGFARYTTTPGVLGLSQSAAVARLEKAGLKVEVAAPDWSNATAAGLVMRTDPGGGDRVLDHGTVTITLSKGPEVYKLPDLAGKTLDEAQDAITGLEMSFGKAVDTWSETVPSGQVIRTDPKAGTELPPGSNVDVWVSRGRQPITVTSWVGKDADQAKKALTKAGLKVDTTSRYDDSVAKGLVMTQSPDTGTLYKGDTVSLLVSKGPELVEVPHGLRAMGVKDATEKLEALGFKVVTQQSDHYLGLGYVWDWTPNAGEKIPKGSTITLYLV
ncbi:Stk1 family PASTA domain-containing Ser/Thr kinase [Nocardioides sp. Kera G14]|uniref:Stk1 family PASTA domain-containing Ser/Thr kinase n=1 Tax=Nocardioides sp. Kera G14 TaxID=2884264 RepID=UPI001D12381F|nr:Stk1 family PASTA domain-containing Ser/Thr kinase [Nocardioides sp. Kera G14]UDY22506.1 Stk1 family PASTA domain-containing Ser/Thr kinase [Nocardioides sp. Kera G14]